MQTTVRKLVDGKLLNQVVALPEAYQNELLEIIITPAPVRKTVKKISRAELLSKLSGSHTEALTGIIQVDHDISLEEYRMERLKKYDCAD